MKKACVLSYLLSAQRRLWSDCADAQTDLSFSWAHTHFVGFVMSRLILLSTPSQNHWHIGSTCLCKLYGLLYHGFRTVLYDKTIQLQYVFQIDNILYSQASETNHIQNKLNLFIRNAYNAEIEIRYTAINRNFLYKTWLRRGLNYIGLLTWLFRYILMTYEVTHTVFWTWLRPPKRLTSGQSIYFCQ